jgi:hypothetical protein
MQARVRISLALRQSNVHGSRNLTRIPACDDMKISEADTTP